MTTKLPATQAMYAEMEVLRVTREEEAAALVRCNRLMTERKRAGDAAGACAILYQMRHEPRFPYPDVVSFNIAIDACGKAGDVPTMDALFLDMFEQALRPNVRTFTSMIHAHGRRGNRMRVAALLSEMQAMGIEWTDVTRTCMSVLGRASSSA